MQTVNVTWNGQGATRFAGAGHHVILRKVNDTYESKAPLKKFT